MRVTAEMSLYPLQGQPLEKILAFIETIARRCAARGRRQSAEHAGARRARRRDGTIADGRHRALVRRRRRAGARAQDLERRPADRRAAGSRASVTRSWTPSRSYVSCRRSRRPACVRRAVPRARDPREPLVLARGVRVVGATVARDVRCAALLRSGAATCSTPRWPSTVGTNGVTAGEARARRELPIGVWPLKTHVLAIGGSVALAAVIGWFMSRHTAAAFPYLDAFVTVSSVVTTYMVARKILENWLYWLVIDSLSMYLYWQRELYLYVGLVRALSRARRHRARPLASRLARAGRDCMTRAAADAAVARVALGRVVGDMEARRAQTRAARRRHASAQLARDVRRWSARRAAHADRALERAARPRDGSARDGRGRRRGTCAARHRGRRRRAACCSRSIGPARPWTSARSAPSVEPRASRGAAAHAARVADGAARVRRRAHRRSLRLGACLATCASRAPREWGDELMTLARRYDAALRADGVLPQRSRRGQRARRRRARARRLRVCCARRAAARSCELGRHERLRRRRATRAACRVLAERCRRRPSSQSLTWLVRMVRLMAWFWALARRATRRRSVALRAVRSRQLGRPVATGITTMANVAFLGLGVMGFPMAGWLARKGHAVTVYNRTAAKAEQWRTQYEGKSRRRRPRRRKAPRSCSAASATIPICATIALGSDGAIAAMRRGAIYVRSHDGVGRRRARDRGRGPRARRRSASTRPCRAARRAPRTASSR